jgi:hypothetical protein
VNPTTIRSTFAPFTPSRLHPLHRTHPRPCPSFDLTLAYQRHKPNPPPPPSTSPSPPISHPPKTNKPHQSTPKVNRHPFPPPGKGTPAPPLLPHRYLGRNSPLNQSASHLLMLLTPSPYLHHRHLDDVPASLHVASAFPPRSIHPWSAIPEVCGNLGMV